jgi:hypothetical protein
VIGGGYGLGWNGKWVAFNRDNVEEIIERERPVKP